MEISKGTPKVETDYTDSKLKEKMPHYGKIADYEIEIRIRKIRNFPRYRLQVTLLHEEDDKGDSLVAYKTKVSEKSVKSINKVVRELYSHTKEKGDLRI